MPDETYYSLLEISETASAAEIKTAYLRLIREVHPDRLANAPAYWLRQAEEKSKEINEAYAVLSNREKRHLYDIQLASYRGSPASISQSPASPPTNTTKQGPYTTSTEQSTSWTGARSTQTHQSAPRQGQAASKPSNSTSPLNKGQRLFFAFIGSIFGLGAAATFWTSWSFGDGAFAFLLAAALLFGVACLYQHQIGRLLFALHVGPKHQLWAIIGIIVLVLFVGKIANMNRDTHFRGPDDHSASTAQMSQVKIINGNLSDTTVSGHSNEKYPSAYNFTGTIQNNSTAIVSFIRMKIRIFNCPATDKPSSHTLYGITYQSGTFDPSPPSSCKNIGEEEEDNFLDAEPGQTSGFGNFYFPNHPQGGLRWNYEITKMDTRNAAASVSDSSTSDVHGREHSPPHSGAQQITTKSGPEKVASLRQTFQAAQQSSLQVGAQQSLPAAAPLAASPGTSKAAAQEEVEVSWWKSLSGSWVGEYTCAQGVTGLTLTIAESADGGLSGIFDFYPVPGGNRFPEGSYSGDVTADPDGRFEFKPQRWISQPPGFTAVALSGRYSAEAQRVQGQVTGMAGCTLFDLSRRSGHERTLPTTYDISSLSASDHDSIESACSGARLVQGAAAYHRCLNTQLEELARYPGIPDLSKLDGVDRASIESACSGARLVQGAAAYHRCLNTQLEELARYPNTPNLGGLSSIDRNSIESACSGARLVQGPASYHRCLTHQLSELEGR
ncbi:DnaJ domain-containing protein [Granulicella sp. 5B5]|uniref:J domain-containing protein n=1 Tax=Granulicella sp. 5B5 TaxID=1617967 RepID=UPI0015F37459|nr:J domain-containing protein [Granulicella sp. 5B5]QMV19546.1 DnaJ domain-containing protein [Granulicella sp. 5B5]